VAISFFNEDVDLPEMDYEVIDNWLRDVIASSSKTTGNLSIIFCSDEYLIGINKQFLDHDYFTDIITFNYSSKKVISGDLFISVDTVNSNSLLFNSNLELLRVIVHGVLHLLGFDDKLDQDKILMRNSEDFWLEKFISLSK
jgi:rRNA maturation RNase YbeY